MNIRTRKRPDAEESARALSDVQKLFEVTPLMRAHANLESARGEFHAATLALMNREPGCEARADRALAELNAARAELRRLDGDA